MSRLPRAHSPDSLGHYPVGDYDFDGISFSLSNPLISSVHHSVSGYAVSSSVLAVVSDPIPLNTVFIDGDTQNLLQVTNVLTTDRDVVFYNVSVQNPLSVFVNLRMRTTANGVSCSTRLGPYESDQCGKVLLVNWDENKDMPKSKEILTGLSVLLGSRMRSLISFDFLCRGLKHVGLNYAFSFNGTAGIGVIAKRAVNREFDIEPSYCFGVFSKSVDLGLFTLSAVAESCIGVGVKRVDISLPTSAVYYRTYLLTADQHGFISTTGMDFSPFSYDVTTNRNSDFNAKQVFEVFSDIKLLIVPDVQAYIQVRLSVGPLMSYFARAGLVLRSEWKFQLDAEKCTCPYLYGGTSTSLFGFFAVPALDVYGVRLIPEYVLESPLFQGLASDPQCVFASGKSREGSAGLLVEKSQPAYMFSRFQFLGQANQPATKVYLQLQAVDPSDKVYANSAFAPIPWGRSARAQKRVVAGTVVIRMTAGGKIRWRGSQSVVFIPRNEDFDADVTFGPHTGRWGKFGTDVSYSVMRAQSVEIFKEFAGANSRFVSFRPDVPEGSVLGAIIHGVNGEEYKTAVLRSVIDDKQTSVNSIEFVGKAELTITIASFKILVNTASAAKLEFYRDNAELLVLSAVGLTPGVAVSGEKFDFSGLDFDLAGRPRLRVRVGVATTANDRTGQEDLIVFEYRELNGGNSFSIKKKTPIFEAEFRFTRSQPNVVFEFPNRLTPQSRAIVCRILKVQGNLPLSVELPQAENYGILRFAGLTLPRGRNAYVLVSMPGLTPLCKHRVMNSGDFLIAINSSANVFRTHLQIPFRRSSGSYSGKVAALGVFRSTADATCRKGLEVSAPGNRLNVGCFEPVVFGKTMSQGWVSLPVPSSTKTVAASPDRGTTVEAGTFKLHLYETQKPGPLNIYPSYFTIPHNSVFLELEDEAIAPFTKNRVNVTVECPRAAAVGWECGQLKPVRRGLLAADPRRPGKFTGVPECAGSGLQFIAKCEDSSQAFCEFSLAVPQVSLLRYRTAAGLIEVAATVKTGKFLQGVTRQIVQRKVPARVFKNWEGPVEIEPISKPGVLTITATIGDKNVELSADLNGLHLPFSAEKYYANPSAFFGNLSIRSSTTGYRPDVAYFTDRGTVVAGTNYYDEIPVKAGITVANLLDLPKSFVQSQEYETARVPAKSNARTKPKGTKTGGKKSKLTTGVIIGVAVGGFALVVLVIVAIVVVRSGKKEGGNVTPVAQKASDTAREEEPSPVPQ